MAAARSVVTGVVDAVVCLLLGAGAALFGAFVHPAVLVIGDVAWPLGLALAIGLEVLALRLAAGVAGRRGVWQTGAAWVVVVLLLTWPRAAGDIVVPGTWYGYAFLVLGMGAAMVSIALTWTRSIVREATTTSASLPTDR